MGSKLLVSLFGIIPVITYGETCTETATSYTCTTNVSEIINRDNLDKAYSLSGGNGRDITVNLNDANIELDNFTGSVINVGVGNFNGWQRLNVTGDNTINVTGTGGGSAIRFDSNGNGNYNISDNLNINVNKQTGNDAAIYLYTTNTALTYNASGTIQTNAGTGLSATGGGTFTVNINSPSFKIITSANQVTANAHHGILLNHYGSNGNINIGTTGENQIHVDVRSGIGSALVLNLGSANPVNIGSYNNSATGNISLSGGYGDVFSNNSAGLSLISSNSTNTGFTTNIGSNVVIDSGNDVAIRVGAGSQMIVNNQGILNGYVTTTESLNANTPYASLVLNNEKGSTWNLSNFGPDGTAKNSIINNFNGGTFTNAGRLQFADKNFDGTTTDAVFNLASFTNSGIIDLTGKNPTSKNDLVGDTLTINGDYISDGGSIYLNTKLDDATSNNGQGTSDLISVNGNVSTATNGATKLYITPTASSANLGGLTVGNGIKVVNVQGTSSTDAFALGKKLVAGSYEYTLGKGKADDNWYLSSFSNNNGVITYNPAIGAYLANQTAAVQMFQQTLFDRLISSSDVTNDASKNLLWMRTKMTHGSYDSAHENLSNRTRTYTLQMGGDLHVWALQNGGYFHLGAMGGYGDFKDTSKSDTTGTKADGKVKGYTAGIYGTYFANQDTNLGLYVDMWSQMGWYRNEISGEAQQGTKKYNSTVWSNSVELGYGIPLANSVEYQWLATPQVQLTYNSYDADNQHDKNNLYVSNNNASGLDTRVGIRFHARGIKENLIEPFLEVNWLDTTAKNKLNFNDKAFKDGFAKDRLEAKVGLQGNINKNWSASAQVGGQWGNNSFKSYQGQLSLNYTF